MFGVPKKAKEQIEDLKNARAAVETQEQEQLEGGSVFSRLMAKKQQQTKAAPAARKKLPPLRVPEPEEEEEGLEGDAEDDAQLEPEEEEQMEEDESCAPIPTPEAKTRPKKATEKSDQAENEPGKVSLQEYLMFEPNYRAELVMRLERIAAALEKLSK